MLFLVRGMLGLNEGVLEAFLLLTHRIRTNTIRLDMTVQPNVIISVRHPRARTREYGLAAL
jgi:hypothetical protein